MRQDRLLRSLRCVFPADQVYDMNAIRPFSSKRLQVTYARGYGLRGQRRRRRLRGSHRFFLTITVSVCSSGTCLLSIHSGTLCSPNVFSAAPSLGITNMRASHSSWRCRRAWRGSGRVVRTAFSQHRRPGPSAASGQTQTPRETGERTSERQTEPEPRESCRLHR